VKASFDTTTGRMVGNIIKVNNKTIIVKIWSRKEGETFRCIKRHKERHHVIIGEE